MRAPRIPAGGRRDVAAQERVRRASAGRYLPHALAATAAVVALPVAIVWLLRARGIVSWPPACVAVGVALSLAASYAGSALWKRRQAGDLLFSELLIWGWVHRVRVERRLAHAVALLRPDGAPAGGPPLTPEEVDERRRELVGLAAALEAQDPYTAGHSRRVARHAELIGRELGLPADDLRRLVAAAAVHDVGKLYVPLELLHKPARLTDEEFALVRRHAEDGAAMVSPLGDGELTAIVRHHHERIDGSGYPGGLRGHEIPLGARIVAVADTFDAIIEARPYRAAAPHKRALDILVRESETQFDPAVVAAFVSGYGKRRSVVPWATLGVVVGGARPWQRALRVSGQLNAIAAVGLIALLAVLAAGHRRPAGLPSHTPAVAVHAVGGISRHAAHVTRSPSARYTRYTTPRPPARPAAASPTCQSYSPQVCTVLSTAGGSAGNASSGSAPGGGGTGVRGASTAGLPFTG